MANLDRAPSNRAMWHAYAFAPAVTPIAFVTILAPMGIVLPVIAFVAAILICYLVAAVIGMPIAFLLRRRNALNGYTIHGAAFCWGMLSSTTCATASIYVTAAIGGTWDAVPLVVAYFSAVIVPPVLLSGTAFWLLLRKTTVVQPRNNANDSRSLPSPKTADNHPLQRSGSGEFFRSVISFAAAR